MREFLRAGDMRYLRTRHEEDLRTIASLTMERDQWKYELERMLHHG